MKNLQYDFIICGAGCAGLTLFYEILPYATANSKKILIIEKKKKKENDRTWCFWDTSANVFENIIAHKWEILSFKSNSFSNTFSIAPYKYKMLYGIDFYNSILKKIEESNNVDLIEEEVYDLSTKNDIALVHTKNLTYTATYVFNSIVFDTEKLITPNSLLQHFKGIVIETKVPIFNPRQATLMDFTLNQGIGTNFMYVMPISTNIALVEYTLFTKKLLPQNDYDNALEHYIRGNLKINDYKILHTEFGIIPMTDYKFKSNFGNIINIGTAAGWVKPSSGYAFKNIQTQTKKIVALLMKGKKPIIRKTLKERKFFLYDSILLEVIAKNKMKGSDIFASIFKKNSPQMVLKFLDNETNLLEDLKIMASVPMKIFLPIAFRQMVSCKWLLG